MYRPISGEIFTIQCDTCGYDIAYQYEEMSVQEAMKQDGWHKDKDSHNIYCHECYVPDRIINLDGLYISDLVTIAFMILPGKEFFTRKGLLENIYKRIEKIGNLDWLPESIRVRYGKDLKID